MPTGVKEYLVKIIHTFSSNTLVRKVTFSQETEEIDRGQEKFLLKEIPPREKGRNIHCMCKVPRVQFRFCLFVFLVCFLFGFGMVWQLVLYYSPLMSILQFLLEHCNTEQRPEHDNYFFGSFCILLSYIARGFHPPSLVFLKLLIKILCSNRMKEKFGNTGYLFIRHPILLGEFSKFSRKYGSLLILCSLFPYTMNGIMGCHLSTEERCFHSRRNQIKVLTFLQEECVFIERCYFSQHLKKN